MNANQHLIETLTSSKIYLDYERAFSEATGMPMALRALETWKMPNHGKKNENPFCGLMAQKSRACAACLQTQQQLCESATREPQTRTCAHGLVETAVPIRMGDQHIGFLQTGQVFRKKPTEAQFKRTENLVKEWGLEVNPQELRERYFQTKVKAPKQYEAEIKLLNMFAQHLSMVTNQVVIQQENAEPPAITRAKAFITEHQGEDLRLGLVAKAVNMSCFYFCKMFKKVTGVNFTVFLSRTRIEKAKNLLLNPNLRISEIAFAVGFQSLTHFNRVFKRLSGQSPTDYRLQLPTVG
jgi:AraC-like DNA-binding protein/ligand-binding sensor protein